MPVTLHHHKCGGVVQALYVRTTTTKGRRWLRVGSICTRCHALQGDLTRGPIEELVDAGRGDRPAA